MSDTDGGQPSSRMRGDLFKPSGKWGYTVWLDYGDQPYAGSATPDLPWEDPAQAAVEALARATDAGTSGVTISDLDGYWTLVVLDPPTGFPVMATPHT